VRYQVYSRRSGGWPSGRGNRRDVSCRRSWANCCTSSSACPTSGTEKPLECIEFMGGTASLPRSLSADQRPVDSLAAQRAVGATQCIRVDRSADRCAVRPCHERSAAVLAAHR
jgi:hypothetical protein